MPASFLGRSVAEVWFTPWDTPNGELEARIASLFQRAKGPIEMNWYNVSLAMVFDEASAAIARGIDLEATFDHVQWAGASERALGQAFLAKNDAQARSGKFLVGTSLHSTIDHLKGINLNVQKKGYEVPDADFDTVDEALDAGYPLSVLGSWNPSKGASMQFNFVAIMPGKLISAAFHTALTELREYIWTHEKAYSPWALETPEGLT